MAWSCVLGPVLPGDEPGLDSMGALAAPSGAGALAAVLLPGPAGAIEAAPGEVMLWPLVDGGGVVWPGERPGLVCTGPLVELVAAGAAVEVWAQAMPVETMRAAEASQSERILISCLRNCG
jgi:hypothetical protein